MNRLFVTTSLALALGCGAAFAQTVDPQQSPSAQTPGDAPMHPGHHRPNPHRQAEMLSRKLNLTPDQTSRIEPLLASRDQQMEALHGNSQLAPEERHNQMRAINQQTEQGMAAILSPDQLAQLAQLRQMHHHRMHGGGQPGEAPSPAPAA